MKNICLIVLLLLSVILSAQENIMYVAAKTGLNIREKPDVTAKLLDKIPYGAKVSLQQTDEETKKINTEGFTGFWKKATYNQTTGYIIDSYLLPIAPPAAGTKTIKDYLAQMTTAFGEKLVIKKGFTDSEDVGAELSKQLYKNGAEWHEYIGYEYNSMMYFIPGLTMQQAFLLIRLIPEFADYIGEKDEYITAGKKIKKNNREYEYKVEKAIFGNTPWINKIKIGFEDGAIYNFEMYQVDDQIVIFYGSGV